jgi:hypothetical protein
VEGCRGIHFDLGFTGTGTFPLAAMGGGGNGPRVKLRGIPSDFDPVPGSAFITITEINTSTRKIKATFNMTLKNAANQTVTFTNGVLIVNNW